MNVPQQIYPSVRDYWKFTFFFPSDLFSESANDEGSKHGERVGLLILQMLPRDKWLRPPLKPLKPLKGDVIYVMWYISHVMCSPPDEGWCLEDKLQPLSKSKRSPHSAISLSLCQSVWLIAVDIKFPRFHLQPWGKAVQAGVAQWGPKADDTGYHPNYEIMKCRKCIIKKYVKLVLMNMEILHYFVKACIPKGISILAGVFRYIIPTLVLSKEINELATISLCLNPWYLSPSKSLT